MSLEKIIEKLEKEKESKILEIKQKAEKDLNKILDERKKELESWKEEKKRALEEKISRDESIFIAKERLEFKTEIARLENEYISKLEEKIFEKFLSLKKEEYQGYWEKILEKEGIRGAEIILAEGEEDLDVKALCEKFDLIYKGEKSLGRKGFLLRKDNLVIDFILENIIEEKIKENLLDLAKILRGE